MIGKVGQTVQATVTATDSDGDEIILEQVAGPGSFFVVRGRGMASGTWTWTVSEYYARGPRWEMVTFRAEDGFGGVGLATLVVWVERPLYVYASPVVVERGGAAWASIGVDDGDPSPIPLDFLPVELAFEPPPGISVRETGVFVRSGPGFSLAVEVRVDQRLCPGTYAVPFTVGHLLDNRAASGILFVHVVGNRPPQARPPELRGELTVTLTPKGIVRSPVAMRIPRFGIPTATKFSWRLPVFRPSTPQAFPLSSLP